jgi:DNA-binding Lrp family transcriptional regulator
MSSKSLGVGSLPFLRPRGWHARPNIKIDIDLLHIYLWKNCDHFGRCSLTIAAVAERLNLSRPRVQKYYGRMMREGRIKDFGRRILVAEPGLWAFDRTILDAVETLPGKRN